MPTPSIEDIAQGADNILSAIRAQTEAITAIAQTLAGAGKDDITLPNVGTVTPDWRKLSFLATTSLVAAGTIVKQAIREAEFAEGQTALPDSSFDGFPNLEKVSLPDSLTTINTAAFRGCSSLAEIALPPALATIGASAFQSSGLKEIVFPSTANTGATLICANCGQLTTATWSNPTATIGTFFFQDCAALKHVTLPSALAVVPEGCFQRDISLEDIHLPDTLTTVGANAFDGCSKLRGVHLGPNVTSLGNYAFRACAALTHCEMPWYPSAVPAYFFQGCSALTSVILSERTTTIGDYAFAGCTGLESLDFLDGVTTINTYAVSGCAGLKSISLPLSIKTLGAHAFRDCSYAETADLPGVTTLTGGANNSWQGMFHGSIRLRAVNMPSVVTIGQYVFCYLPLLERLVIPETCTSIGSGAVRGCAGLKSVIINATNLTSLPALAFLDCYALRYLDVPTSVTTLTGGNLMGCLQNCFDLRVVIFRGNITSIGQSTSSGARQFTYYAPAPLTWPSNAGTVPIYGGTPDQAPSEEEVLAAA
jgi:hypothetical protein